MLFLLNSLDPARLDEATFMSGREDKSIVLYGDASYYATASMIGKLTAMDFEEIFVEESSMESRSITAHESAEAIGPDEIADMILNDHDRVVSL